ncbi:hypothetical protein AB0I81_31980 [Nonomuraea sp. NPDC050404]|uniref:hypothetical protein n=1 Tax=Nonomuraea sp. NPDC050404 TaxID=3155783 RepID=UPI0033D67F8F
MADHDRDAGSRGEEEAPRDPTPTEPISTESESASASAESAATEPTRELKYGEQADRAYAEIPTTSPNPVADWEQEPPDSSFPHRRRPQILAAALIGLFVGGLLGGTTVAAMNDHPHDLGDRYDVWLEPHQQWEPHHRYWGPGPGDWACAPGDEGAHCIPSAPRVGVPDDSDEEDTNPEPSWTG